MRRMINSDEYEIRTNPDGSINADVVRKEAGIPPNRALVLQRDDGSNMIVNPGEKVFVKPSDHFADMPISVRG